MLEAVIALAVLSLSAALVFTRASVALDQISVHVAFQDFQTSLLRLRAQAFAREEARDVEGADVPLPQGWSFRADGPLRIGADGACSAGAVSLVYAERVRARLAPVGRECRFARLS